MIATQYKIILPSDYNMNIIKERIKNNGYKTDGFDGLKYKFYLITEKGRNNSIQNSYSPLYLWKDSEGLNKFTFEGYYDNILASFGWQNINVGIPLIDTTTDRVKNSTYLFEIEGVIEQKISLKNMKATIEERLPDISGAEYMVIYNPDKWKYSAVYFLDDTTVLDEIDGVVYKILHVSGEKNKVNK